MQMLNFTSKIKTILQHPSIIKSIVYRKSLDEIRANLDKVDKYETIKFISYMEQNFPYSINSSYRPTLNRLCSLEDWNNDEIQQTLSELKSNPTTIVHRKDWEFAMGIIAMKRFNKLNYKNTAIGIGSGKEEALFYLANQLKHVYATDLYNGKDWNISAPSDFPENPRKYAPFPYKEDALTVLRMDGTNLEFPSETFDIAFSFSSIEHFGGEHHEGALKCLKEIERVLKKDGIAVIATEYILNGKDHPEFYNKNTIYSDLIDKLDLLKLVEPLDLRITRKTLYTTMDFNTALNWDNLDNNFKKSHPHIILRIKNILVTSVMLVFNKK